jgi:hypothetical protein
MLSECEGLLRREGVEIPKAEDRKEGGDEGEVVHTNLVNSKDQKFPLEVTRGNDGRRQLRLSTQLGTIRDLHHPKGTEAAAMTMPVDIATTGLIVTLSDMIADGAAQKEMGVTIVMITDDARVASLLPTIAVGTGKGEAIITVSGDTGMSGDTTMSAEDTGSTMMRNGETENTGSIVDGAAAVAPAEVEPYCR